MNIGPHLASKLPSTTKALNLLITPASSVFQLTFINSSDVLNLLKNLVANKSAGLVRIPNKLLKVAANIIPSPFVYFLTILSQVIIFLVIGKLRRFFHSTRATIKQILTIIVQFPFYLLFLKLWKGLFTTNSVYTFRITN